MRQTKRRIASGILGLPQGGCSLGSWVWAISVCACSPLLFAET